MISDLFLCESGLKSLKKQVLYPWFALVDNEWLPIASRRTKSHQNERDLEAMQVWDIMVEERLIRIGWYYLYQQDTSSFR